MSRDTIMMQWTQLKALVQKADEQSNSDLWAVAYSDLGGLQDYMKQKGYTITTNRVISPEGDILWKSQS